MRRFAALITVALVVSGCSQATTPVTTEPAMPTESSTSVTTSSAPTTSTAAPIATTTVAPTTTTVVAPTTTTTTTTLPPDPLQDLALELVADGLHQPTAITSVPGDARLFVVERRGRVRIIADGELLETPFLDIEEQVNWAAGIEQGMLGLAFHPNYAENGRFFVYYSGTTDERKLVEFTISDDPNVASAASGKVLLSRPQPTDIIRHYAGHLEFGPDGMLYVSVGDGAAPRINGQDPGTVFGAILRLDVDGGETYAIPADNPFVDGGGAAEVWAFGLRNPWRFSIDAETGLMYIGDVGQEHWEEINLVALDAPGANFGWPDTEGARCFLLDDCNLDDYSAPLLEYSHDEGCSVTGGRVYRGSAIPEIVGHYFYADWCQQWVKSFELANGEIVEQVDWSSSLSNAAQVQAFGIDSSGELYIVNFGGQLLKLVAER